MFTYICICISGAFCIASYIKGYREVSFTLSIILFCMFLFKKIAFLTVYEPYLYDYGWSLYYMYAFINLLAMYLFWKLKAHFLISLLVFTNVCYNICTALCFEGYTSVLFYYNLREPFPFSIMAWIMIIELAYVGKINLDASRNMGNDRDNKRNPSDWLFCVRPRNLGRSIL